MFAPFRVRRPHTFHNDMTALSASMLGEFPETSDRSCANAHIPRLRHAPSFLFLSHNVGLGLLDAGAARFDHTRCGFRWRLISTRLGDASINLLDVFGLFSAGLGQIWDSLGRIRGSLHRFRSGVNDIRGAPLRPNLGRWGLNMLGVSVGAGKARS